MTHELSVSIEVWGSGRGYSCMRGVSRVRVRGTRTAVQQGPDNVLLLCGAIGSFMCEEIKFLIVVPATSNLLVPVPTW